MPTIEPYQQQHQEILALVTDILGHLQETTVKNDARRVLDHIALLAEKLRLHLAQEDNLLYPALLRHTDPQVRETARRYMDTMGNLSQSFQAYCTHWNNPLLLGTETQEFVRATRDLFEALARRMLSEETELYPLSRKAGL